MKTGRVLKLGQNKDGYLIIDLYNEQNRKACNVHRLVAQEFIDNPDNKPDVDHVDHDLKNCINNLRWASTSENAMNRNKKYMYLYLTNHLFFQVTFFFSCILHAFNFNSIYNEDIKYKVKQLLCTL